MNKLSILNQSSVFSFQNEIEMHPVLGTCRMPFFSFFQNPIKNILPASVKSLLDVYGLITGEKYKSITQKLRSNTDETQIKSCKEKNFDYVTFSGIFKKRNDSAILNHSGLLVVDFDDVSDIDGLKSKLMGDQMLETQLLFISPTGKGLKWIIEIDVNSFSHHDCFRAIENYIMYHHKIEIDTSGKDVSRASFLCHDPSAYLNPKYLIKCNKHLM